MRRVAFIFMAIVAMAATACINEDMPKRKDVVRVGHTLPDFSVVMNNGEVVTADMLRDGVSVIVFFHTSCPDCQELLPQMQTLYDEYTERDVTFVLISREETAESVSAFWAQHNLTMPYSPQEDRTIYELFANTLIPRVYISDDGVVQAVFDDNPVPSYNDIEIALNGLL